MAGEVTFTPSETDYVAALALNFRHQVRSRALLRPMAIVIGVAVLVLIVVAIVVDGDPLGTAAVALGGVAGGIGAVLIVIAINRLLLPRTARRLFRQQKSLHREHVFVWDDVGTQWRSSVGDVRLGWGDYHRWIDGKDTILLFLNDQLFHFLPARVFDPVRFANLRATIIASEVPRS